MNTKQLWTALTYHHFTNPIFDGVYCKDTLKDITQKPDLIICNTDDCDGPGEHWVLFYFVGHRCVEFYDSLGRDISFYGESFVNFVQKFADVTKQCNKRTQPLNTSVCGEYCLFYIAMRGYGKSMEEIVSWMPSVQEVVREVEGSFIIPNYFGTRLLHNCVKY